MEYRQIAPVVDALMRADGLDASKVNPAESLRYFALAKAALDTLPTVLEGTVPDLLREADASNDPLAKRLADALRLHAEMTEMAQRLCRRYMTDCNRATEELHGNSTKRTKN